MLPLQASDDNVRASIAFSNVNRCVINESALTIPWLGNLITASHESWYLLMNFTLISANDNLTNGKLLIIFFLLQ